MPTRNVVLSEQQHEFVESLVQSGRYQNASEVLRDGLRLVRAAEAEEAAKLDVLHAAAQKEWDDVADDRCADVDDDDGVYSWHLRQSRGRALGRESSSPPLSDLPPRH